MSILLAKHPSYVLKPSLQQCNKAWRADHHAAHCPGSSIPHTLAPGEKETGLRPRESEERASHEKTTCGAFVVRACVMVMERERERECVCVRARARQTDVAGILTQNLLFNIHPSNTL
jgi:hypothetical protein